MTCDEQNRENSGAVQMTGKRGRWNVAGFFSTTVITAVTSVVEAPSSLRMSRERNGMYWPRGGMIRVPVRVFQLQATVKEPKRPELPGGGVWPGSVGTPRETPGGRADDEMPARNVSRLGSSTCTGRAGLGGVSELYSPTMVMELPPLRLIGPIVIVRVLSALSVVVDSVRERGEYPLPTGAGDADTVLKPGNAIETTEAGGFVGLITVTPNEMEVPAGMSLATGIVMGAPVALRRKDSEALVDSEALRAAEPASRRTRGAAMEPVVAR
mmetsp:Transcript_11440/g.26018  ORF Transcript_11440/g.26018 Transcript_11440/m.26018 type:complete len:269 (+) Transcript_11440:5482-6288(+)